MYHTFDSIHDMHVEITNRCNAACPMCARNDFGGKTKEDLELDEWTKEDIDNAVSIFKKKNCPFELMHCVSTYPMKTKDANLTTINQLKKEYKCNVGYSGHENGVIVSVAAALLGITSLERHITLDRTMYGSDQAASLELSGMKNLSELIDITMLALGKPSLGIILDDEKPIAKKLRAHIKKFK